MVSRPWVLLVLAMCKMGALSHNSHLEMTLFSDKLLFILLGLINFALFWFSKINSQPSAVSELLASLNTARVVEASGYLFSILVSGLVGWVFFLMNFASV